MVFDCPILLSTFLVCATKELAHPKLSMWVFEQKPKVLVFQPFLKLADHPGQLPEVPILHGQEFDEPRVPLTSSDHVRAGTGA
jgi:hypothetical protein